VPPDGGGVPPDGVVPDGCGVDLHSSSSSSRCPQTSSGRLTSHFS
jgi:hypothetical protein